MSEAAPTQVLLVDDHTLFREGLRRMLDAEPGMRVCGDFASADEALEAVRRNLQFDVALLDYELSVLSIGGGMGTTGIDLLQSLRKLRPDARVLMVTAGMGISDLLRVVQELNTGIFLKTEPIAELMLAIERTVRGERWISSGAALEMLSAQNSPSPRTVRPVMSERESAVLRGVLEGLGNKEIGARLDLSESAVKAVLQKLFEKTGVRSRSQLVRYAIEADSGAGRPR